VAEAAVVGYPHPIKGEGIYSYVLLNSGYENNDKDELIGALKQQVRNAIGAFAAPDVIHIVSGLPKTRSGKIMRRILRKVASSDYDSLGDLSTLAEPTIVASLIEEHKSELK
jgi:acetyl-CoA synthetase